MKSTKEKILKLHNEGYSTYEISMMLGIDEVTVVSILETYGLM